MGRKKQTWLRACGRWGLTLLSVALFGVLVLSWFYSFGIGRTIVGPDKWSRDSVWVGQGSVYYSKTPYCRSCWGGPPAESSVSSWAYSRKHIMFEEMTRGAQRPVGQYTVGSTAGTEYVRYVSGFIPVGVVGLVAIWMWIGVWRSRRRAGCCRGCGYSLVGLTSDVCPECGEKYA